MPNDITTSKKMTMAGIKIEHDRRQHRNCSARVLAGARWLAQFRSGPHRRREFEQKSDDTMTMSMVDAKISGFKDDRSWVNYFVAAKGHVGTGLPGDKYRLYLAGEPEGYLEEHDPKEAFSEGWTSSRPVRRSTAWNGPRPDHIRKIVGEFYQRGKVLLRGDATHVHSPAGGQVHERLHAGCLQSRLEACARHPRRCGS